jgi:hypothetical protein
MRLFVARLSVIASEAKQSRLQRGLDPFVAGDHEGVVMENGPAANSIFDLSNTSTVGLLRAYGTILDELRKRSIVRSSNSPLSDYAELLFCEAFGWARQNGSAAGYDAIDAAGQRYQIKARRITSHRRSSRQLSAIRNIDQGPFHHLAGILFDHDFQITCAVLVPFEVVRARSDFVPHTNSHKFHLREDVCSLPEVTDVTSKLRATAE